MRLSSSGARFAWAFRLLAIPHGRNLSNGLVFDDVSLTTKRPLDQSYAERRMRWEPLFEVTQMKGDGETHPAPAGCSRQKQRTLWLGARDDFRNWLIRAA